MKILVIDDEPLIHISIEKLIQACSKEDEVLHAYNGHEMLKMLEEHEIAMAYVDIKMPGPSGLEAIKLGKEISPDTRYYIINFIDITPRFLPLFAEKFSFEYLRKSHKIPLFSNKLVTDYIRALTLACTAA